MNNHAPKLVATLAMLLALNSPLSTAVAQGSAFTYQGRLNNSGSPANGLYDLQFAIYDSTNQPGTLIAGPLINSAIAVSNGLFTTTLDFGGGPFNGANRWLDIAVRTNGSSAFAELAPRQQLTPTPYAIYSANAAVAATADGVATGSITAADIAPGQVLKSLNGYSDAVTFSPGPNIGITAAGNNLQISALGLWTVNGNAGTGPANGNFIGTTDFQPLELKAGGMRVLRLEPDGRTNVGGVSGNLIGGFINNLIEQPGSGADFIGSGGFPAGPNIIHSNSAGVFIGAGSANQVGPNINDAFLGAGFGNTIQAADSVIVGGQNNTIQPFSDYSIIGSGLDNTIQSFATYATLGGGLQNAIGGSASVLGGGQNNTNSAIYAVLGGGLNNTVQSGSTYAVLGGGLNNTVQSTSTYTVLSGGQINLIQSNSPFSTIAGGLENSINGAGDVVSGGENNANSANFSVMSGGVQSSIYPGADYSVIAGGQENFILNDADHSVVGGGGFNEIFGSEVTLVYDTIGGGYFNFMKANSTYSVIGGGNGNIVQSNAAFAVIPGGDNNFAAGFGSYAAGSHAQALHDGTFVWSDSTGVLSTGAFFSSSSSNQFLVNATGGVGINTNNPSGVALNVNGAVKATSFQGDGSALLNVNSAAMGNFLFAFSSVAQTVTTGNAFQDITLNNDAQINGWSHASGTSQYTNAQTGLYLIQYSAALGSTAAGGTNATLRANLNSAEITGSRAFTSVTPAALGADVSSVSKSFIAPLNAADVLTLQFTGSASGVRLAGNPGISLTITRIQ